MTTPNDGVEMNWQQAQDVLACVEQLVARHARLAASAPELSGAADRCADDAVHAIEGIAEPLARWADALDDWAQAVAQQEEARTALADRLVAELLAAQATSEGGIRAVVRAAMGWPVKASVTDEAPTPSIEVGPATIDVPAPPVASEHLQAVDPQVVDRPATVSVEATPVDVSHSAVRRAPPAPPAPVESAELSAAFDFPLHDLDPLAEADEEPSPFEFDDGPANDDLSALQSKDLEDVIEATPTFEVEDTTMGSLGLMDTSALSTDQVRAQLMKIRAERAAAAVAAKTDPPTGVEPEPVPAAVTPKPAESAALDQVSAAPTSKAPTSKAPVSRTPVSRTSAAGATPANRPSGFPPLPRRSTDSLVESAVVEVESGPIDVLDVRQLLGEPPARPSRIDAAVRAALSSPPDAAQEPLAAPRTATADHTDWLETTPTSYPPSSSLRVPDAAAESIEIELGSVDLDGTGDGEMDSTVALQSVDLSAAMESVNAEDWLDASQSVDVLTSNQSLKALAGAAEPEGDDPWAALDISTHSALAGRQARATRATLNISVGIEHGGQFFTARSSNISSAGLLVSCNQHVPDGERVDLFFEMPEGASIAVQGTVSRSVAGDPRHLGLVFINLRYDDRVVIDRYVTARTA